MGFFAWIREGVRRAVLLGFSDAVDELGKCKQGDDLGPQFAMALRESVALPMEEPQERITAAAPRGNNRKRLGRSLEQIREGAVKPA